MYTSKKYLVTGGCSFSQPENADITWPIHLEEYLKPERVLHGGRGCADNTTIARLAIYNVHQMLSSGVSPDQLLVGIMWSGAHRHSVYTTRPDFPHDCFGGELVEARQPNGLPTVYHMNPLFIACEERNQYLMQASFEDSSSRLYWERFYDPIGSQIMSLENVLRLQWYLKAHGIDYFMTEYGWYSIHDHRPPNDYTPKDTLTHPDVSYLLEQIDHDQWLDIDCMSSWVDRNQIPYSRPPDPHPSTEAHQRLLQEIILPHLQSRRII